MRTMRGSTYLFALLGCLLLTEVDGQDTFSMRVRRQSEDTTGVIPKALFPALFRDSAACAMHLKEVSDRLLRQGFLEASIDSVHWQPREAEVILHLGPRYRWRGFRVAAALRDSLMAEGWSYLPDSAALVDLTGFDREAERWVALQGRSGFPFATILLDSLEAERGSLSARLHVDRGPLYRIDSITVDGNLRIRTGYLHRYLDIPPGSLYRTDLLADISGKLGDLPFLREQRPWDMTRTGTGSALNLHLEPKKSNRMDALVAFLPSNSQLSGRLLLAGEANLDLHNAFGSGERIIANWQQLQVQSPRLQLAFEQPFLLGSRFEADLQFMLFRKDSSFLNLDLRAGLRYAQTARRKGGVYYQRTATSLLSVDTQAVKLSRRLPSFVDISTDMAGLTVEDNRTDRITNPRRGISWHLRASAGLRRLRQNATIQSLERDATGAAFDGRSLYDSMDGRRPVLKWRAAASAYVPTGRQGVFRFGMQSGMVWLKDAFRNELFQIGGYHSLRGFDEESIFSSAYGIGTIEYRWLTGPDAHFFVFTDIGGSADRTQTAGSNRFFVGAGMGLRLQTRAGLLDLAYAVGKRNDLPLDFRQSKIHFGIVSVF